MMIKELLKKLNECADLKEMKNLVKDEHAKTLIFLKSLGFQFNEDETEFMTGGWVSFENVKHIYYFDELVYVRDYFYGKFYSRVGDTDVMGQKGGYEKFFADLENKLMQLTADKGIVIEQQKG